MSNVKIIKYKDSLVHLRECDGNGIRKFNPHRCFCCNEQIKDGKALLVINNYKYIPNVFIHEKCFKECENTTDKLFSDIEEAWKKYKSLKEIFG